MAESKKEQPKKVKIRLTKEELQILINIVGQVSTPIASKQAEQLRQLINKMSIIINELKEKKN